MMGPAAANHGQSGCICTQKMSLSIAKSTVERGESNARSEMSSWAVSARVRAAPGHNSSSWRLQVPPNPVLSATLWALIYHSSSSSQPQSAMAAQMQLGQEPAVVRAYAVIAYRPRTRIMEPCCKRYLQCTPTS